MGNGDSVDKSIHSILCEDKGNKRCLFILVYFSIRNVIFGAITTMIAVIQIALQNITNTIIEILLIF
jgi:hypothetical protein